MTVVVGLGPANKMHHLYCSQLLHQVVTTAVSKQNTGTISIFLGTCPTLWSTSRGL